MSNDKDMVLVPREPTPEMLKAAHPAIYTQFLKTGAAAPASATASVKEKLKQRAKQVEASADDLPPGEQRIAPAELPEVGAAADPFVAALDAVDEP